MQKLKETLAAPLEGVLSFTKVDGKDYYCGRVHLDPKEGRTMLPGSRVIIRSVGRENTPRLPGVTFFANACNWDFDTH